MKLRAFLASIPAALFSAKYVSFGKTVPVPPKKEWPFHNGTSPVGLWAQGFDHIKQAWDKPHLILAEFDEQTDNPYQGIELNNCRRNKFWGRPLNSNDRILLCFDRYDTDLRFFKDAPNIDWSTVYPV